MEDYRPAIIEMIRQLTAAEEELQRMLEETREEKRLFIQKLAEIEAMEKDVPLS